MAAVATPPMSGAQKAAVLFMALGAEQAARLTQRLSPDDVSLITTEIARMERVEGDVSERVLREWAESNAAGVTSSQGGVDYARELLEKAFGRQQAMSMVKRVAGPPGEQPGFVRLRNADPEQLASMFRGEHPQTLALILANLPPSQTAAVLKQFDPELSADIAFRIGRMERVAPETIALIEESLGKDLELDLSPGMSKTGGPAAVAAVLNLLQGTLEKQIMEKVADRDQQLSEQIRNLMFVFEDLLGIDDRGLQRLLRDVDVKSLALALKSASAELKGRIMAQMSQRAVGVLKEEMEMLGPVKMKDVEGAQTQIVAQVRALEDAGEIVLGGGGDDVVVG